MRKSALNLFRALFFQTLKHKMKKIYFLSFSLLAFSCLFMSGCKGKDKNAQADSEYVDPRSDENMVRNSADTTAILKICTDYLNLLKADNVEAALDLLYAYDDSAKTVTPIGNKLRNKFRNNLKMFPVLDYQLESMKLYGEDDTEFVFMVKFFEKPEGDPQPNTIREVLSPVRVNGQWFLTVSEDIRNEH